MTEEEESFVILGSSPLPSIYSNANSLLTDALDNLKNENSVAEELNKTSDVVWQRSSISEEQNRTSIKDQNRTSIEEQNQTSLVEEQSKLEANISGPISLSQLSHSLIKSNEGSLPTTLPSESLATSFLMGDVNASVLKNSVYSQFPSLCSMQACAEDVVKIQTMMTDYLAMKQTLEKLTHTMMEYYKATQQWRNEAASRCKAYQEELDQLQTQIENLSTKNKELVEHMQSLENVRQKEHDELRRELSEKSSLINNMRAEIDKLQQHQVPSFEYITEEGKAYTDADHITRDKHERQIKKLERQNSELLAENLEIKDMKDKYVDEITCLKVNLVSAEELIKKMQYDINDLKAKDAQTNEEITNLKAQVEIYRRDFELERTDREANASDKAQYLMDLRALQRRNQELIEALAEAHKSQKSGNASTTASSSKSILRDEQRPVRQVLDPTGAAATTAESTFNCPICLKGFSALTVLQAHVNACLDSN